jgi:hypothetical protein
MIKDLNMSDKTYYESLLRLKERIENGLSLNYEDSTVIGDKYTVCTWGLCSDDKEQWPDPDMHLWPDQFTNDGRVAPKYRENHHLCPFDTRNPNDDEMSLINGCFYTCMIFQRKFKTKPNAEDVVGLFDKRINWAKKNLNV